MPTPPSLMVLTPPSSFPKTTLTSTYQGISPPLFIGVSGQVGASSSPLSAKVAEALESITLLLREPPSSQLAEKTRRLLMEGLSAKAEKGKGSLISNIGLAVEAITLVIIDSNIKEAPAILLHIVVTTALYGAASISF